jgi:hypothetical protein
MIKGDLGLIFGGDNNRSQGFNPGKIGVTETANPQVRDQDELKQSHRCDILSIDIDGSK